MKTRILKYLKTRFFTLTLAFASVISLGILMQSCNKDEEPLDEAILNSTELEEYIIAGADFQKSLAIFADGLNKIDFSTLEVTFDEEGRKKIHLPTEFVGSVRIEEKIIMFNVRKESLQRKFPQIVSFNKNIGKRYLQHCIQNSVNVSSGLLVLGINIHKSLLKSSEYTVSQYGSGELSFLLNDLGSWVSNPSYVELLIIQYSDGSFTVAKHVDATSTQTYIAEITIGALGNLYFQGDMSKKIVAIGHTHTGSGNDCKASEEDHAAKKKYPQVDHQIFCNGALSSY